MRILLLAAIIATAPAAKAPTNLPELGSYLRNCEVAGKRLWGHSLCAPIIVFDPATGQYRTTKAPPSVPLPTTRANTAFKWGDETWIMVLEPLPKDRQALVGLLFHEAFHVHQDTIGLPGNNSVAVHLESVGARYLIRLEWRALAAALKAEGAKRRQHVAQALAFRARRLAGNAGAARTEREQMRHEGLANYTGAALSGDPRSFALKELEAGPQRSSLSRSFAYVSAPAWGLLLDSLDPGWRQRLGSGRDLPDMLSVPAADVTRADDYGGFAVLSEEALAGAEREARLRVALYNTAEDRALKLPLSQMQMNFDPNQVLAAPDGSPLYAKITLTDRWGRVDINGIPLRITSDFSAAFVRWPLSPPDKLELAPGWIIQNRPGGGAILIPPAN